MIHSHSCSIHYLESYAVRRLHRACRLLLNQLETSEGHSIGVIGGTSHHSAGEVGRPRIRINFEYVELLQEAGYTLEEASQALQASRTTLWRHMSEVGMVWGRCTDMSDYQLDQVVCELRSISIQIVGKFCFKAICEVGTYSCLDVDLEKV